MTNQELSHKNPMGIIGDDGRHLEFSSIENGIRAGTKKLVAAYRIHGMKTARQILENFLGGSGSVGIICDYMGVQPDEIIHMEDVSTIEELVAAVIAGLNNGSRYSKQQIADGVNRALNMEKY